MTNYELFTKYGANGDFAGDYYYCYDRDFYEWANNLGIKKHLYYPETDKDCACWIYKLENSFDIFLKMYYMMRFDGTLK